MITRSRGRKGTHVLQAGRVPPLQPHGLRREIVIGARSVFEVDDRRAIVVLAVQSDGVEQRVEVSGLESATCY